MYKWTPSVNRVQELSGVDTSGLVKNHLPYIATTRTNTDIVNGTTSRAI